MGHFLKKIKNSELGLRVLEKIFPITKRQSATILHYHQGLRRFHNCDDRKSPAQIRKEIGICKKFWKCYPYQYYICDLYRNDKDLTDDELVDYIPPFFYYYLFLPHHNSPKYSIIGENKLAMEMFLSATKIVQQRNSQIFYDGHFYSEDMDELSFERMFTNLIQSNPAKIFVKPLEGSGGKGIFAFHKTTANNFVARDKSAFSADFFHKINKSGNYLIQPGIVQDPEISGIYPHSVNTFRVITENLDGNVRIVSAILRMGRAQNDVDNMTSGGVSTSVDTSSGQLGGYAISYNSETYTRHPDTGVVFANQKITRWNEIAAYAQQSAKRFPFFSYIGWDIALTTDGPTVIEINRSPAADIMEITSHGLRKEFGIDNPDYYWKNLGKRLEHIQ